MHGHLLLLFIQLVSQNLCKILNSLSFPYREFIIFSIFPVILVYWGYGHLHNPHFLQCYISIENKTVSSPHKWNKQTIQAEVHKPNWSQNLIMLIISDLYCSLKIDGCTDGWSLVPHSQPITDIGIDTTYSCCAKKFTSPLTFSHWMP